MDEPAWYRIRVLGQVGDRWADDYSAMKRIVTRRPDGATETELVGEVLDQAALLGTINWLYDLGNPLLFVERLAQDDTDGHSQ
jgi:hypothetical protein